MHYIYFQIKNLQEQTKCYESLIDDQTEIIEELKEKLLFTEQQRENYISELNNSKEMVCMLKNLLKEKSDCMAKLQADYQMLMVTIVVFRYILVIHYYIL